MKIRHILLAAGALLLFGCSQNRGAIEAPAFDECHLYAEDAHNVTINNQVNTNNDGFDIDGCKDAIFEGCTVYSGDDSFCPKRRCKRNDHLGRRRGV